MVGPTACSLEAAWRRGFSLVEVILAIGLFAFAVMGILGLLVTALQAGREAQEVSMVTHLGNRLISEMRAAPFAAPAAGTRYFDFEGTAVPQAAQAHYACTVEEIPLPAEVADAVPAGVAGGLARAYRLDWRWPLHAPSPRTFSSLVVLCNPAPAVQP